MWKMLVGVMVVVSAKVVAWLLGLLQCDTDGSGGDGDAMLFSFWKFKETKLISWLDILI